AGDALRAAAAGEGAAALCPAQAGACGEAGGGGNAGGGAKAAAVGVRRSAAAGVQPAFRGGDGGCRRQDRAAAPLPHAGGVPAADNAGGVPERSKPAVSAGELEGLQGVGEHDEGGAAEDVRLQALGVCEEAFDEEAGG